MLSLGWGLPTVFTAIGVPGLIAGAGMVAIGWTRGRRMPALAVAAGPVR